MSDQPRVISAQELEGVTITAAQPLAPSIVLPFNNKPMVTIRPDGTLEFGEDYQPDEAARTFWDAVEQMARNIQFGAPLNASINAELASGQRAQKQVERLDQMAAAWKDQLPETIRRDTAVEAIHQVTREATG